MAKVTFKGSAVNIGKDLPAIGSAAPQFKVVNTDLSEVLLSDFKGKKIVLNVFPSVDTGVCAQQLKTFNNRLKDKENIILLFVSLDLPFAFTRFCGAEGITNAVTASDFRYRDLAQVYGLAMQNGPLAGLLARAVIVLDEEQSVVYTELVPEITEEPNYDAAMAVLS